MVVRHRLEDHASSQPHANVRDGASEESFWSRPSERTKGAVLVLIVDDEPNIRTTLSIYLETLGCSVDAVATIDDALRLTHELPFDLAFVDVRLGQVSGIELVPRLLATRPSLQIAMMTAYPSIESAVDAMRRGAMIYVQKPFAPERIAEVVAEVERKRAGPTRGLPDGAGHSEMTDALLWTESAEMREVLDTVARASQSDVPVLLRGESGTGKGLLARLLHTESPQREGPFVTVNCPTLSEDLLTSELFGHAKGAFTGAVRNQEGRVEAAEGGTLFLDEIGEISPTLQAKLLRFVQEKQFERVGETKTRHANVRLVAATNRNLERDVEDGRFREDLLFRLNVLEVWVPALRARRADILSLARGFVASFAYKMKRPVPTLSLEAEQALVAHSWPGNVRELRNEMERVLLLSSAQILGPEVFFRTQGKRATAPWTGGKFTLEELEREHIRRVLDYAPTMEDAARILGIDVTTLWRKRKRLGR
jgi:NtrC-family two-component system response regulator AlgB